MRPLQRAGALGALVAGLVLLAPAAEAARIRVVTTLPDLKALAEAIGGDLVEVESLARGSQNAHDVEVRPSLMLKLRRADLLVINGLDLDFWIDALVLGANNPAVLPGAAGRVDASRGIRPLEVPTGPVDRSMGDVHPSGNPHYTLDPDTAPTVTANILEGLARVAPGERATFERRRREFLERLGGMRDRWLKALEPFRGQRVMVGHNLWLYFLSRFGLEQAATLEERPGIPPSPAHLARLVRQAREEKIRVLILEPWNDRKLAERVAAESGARVVLLGHAVGAVKGTDTYIEWLDHNVTTLAGALR
jgi:zinc/manganese transport system substrate-binding protein